MRVLPFGAVLIALTLLVSAGLGQAQDNVLGSIKASLDAIEQSTKAGAQSDEAYAEVRRRLTPLREELRGKIEAIEPDLAQIETRLKQLGEPPAASAPPEDPAIAGERGDLFKQRADLDAALKQARLLALRADQIAEQVNERRRAIFASELFTRSAGLLDPGFWRDLARALPVEIDSIDYLLRSWWEFAFETGGRSGLAAAVVMLAILFAAVIALLRWWRRRVRSLSVASRFDRALAATLVLVGHALTGPAVTAAMVLVLQNAGLMPPRMVALGFGLATAVGIASFGQAVAIALFAPGDRARRLFAFGDHEAAALATYLTLGARLLAIVVFLNMLHKALYAPLVLTVATSALLAAGTGILALHLVLRSAVGRIGVGAEMALPGLRALSWLLVAAVTVALATGYTGFAAFVAGRFLVLLAIVGALAVLWVFIDALFTDVLTGDTERGRAAAALFGISTRTMELTGTLTSALIRLLMVLVAIIPVLGPWGIFAADFFGAVKDSAFAFRIGEVTISITAIATAFACLIAGIAAARGVQRWLATRVMPRTGLESGLQHSIATLAGYALLIAALSLTLAVLGVDLQKVALIAGALSVGIGFGLQSVVSNFVSGLILLAERPIRVGDWVVVKNEEGFVRRISVRATEIETFDRASVIIPNSEFITGVVKNWTHSNTMGRITVKTRVSYASDVDKVREILLGAASAHPQVLKSPPPRVFLVALGDIGLEFELRCIVSNVEYGLTVKSDLHATVLQQFRAVGIAISYPPHEARVPGPAAT